MCDEWMAALDLPLTPEQFRRLPRHAAYKYEHFSGRTWINPRPRYYHALLDLGHGNAGAADGAAPGLMLRPWQEADWEGLAPLFAAAFRAQQPFAGLDDGPRLEAARKSLRHTRSGGDGPWIEPASYVAAVPGEGHPVGAILLTLLPAGDLTGWDGYHWTEPPPADAIIRRLGRPHLTWVFVAPLSAGRGVGTALLHAAVRQLLALGYAELASTFLLGNDSSMLWHWRNGFRLLAYPGSRRRV
jgi:GNAT superfamily N-acetyltransferase